MATTTAFGRSSASSLMIERIDQKVVVSLGSPSHADAMIVDPTDEQIDAIAKWVRSHIEANKRFLKETADAPT